VESRCPRSRIVPLAILVSAIAGTVGLPCAPVCAQQSAASKSWTDTITSPFKQGYDAVGRAFSSKGSASRTSVPEDDALSLSSKANPGPDLYVAIARTYEQAGNTVEADRQYQAALKLKPNYLPALIGSAKLRETLDKPEEAIQIYQHAASVYPQEASVFNNLGMCYARQSRPDDAIGAMNRAVQLNPKNPLYRNNIATILVDQGRMQEAFGHLQAAHKKAAAHYNMGYLLNKKGQSLAALQHFTLALNADPSMTAAKQWVDYLQKKTAQAGVPRNPAFLGVKVTSNQPVWPQKDATVPSDASTPRRLPPTNWSQMPAEPPSLPGIFYEPPSVPTAPMPPASSNTALRPLPRVN
jgi:tetratricopeptide (TPR) repeat protein